MAAEHLEAYPGQPTHEREVPFVPASLTELFEAPEPKIDSFREAVIGYVRTMNPNQAAAKLPEDTAVGFAGRFDNFSDENFGEQLDTALMDVYYERGDISLDIKSEWRRFAANRETQHKVQQTTARLAGRYLAYAHLIDSVRAQQRAEISTEPEAASTGDSAA